MIAVRLSKSEDAAYVASPDYLRRRGTPMRPEDLLHHNCIRHRQVSSGEISPWSFTNGESDQTVGVDGGLIVDDLRTVVDAAQRGFGIGWSLRRGVQEQLDKGQLVQVLAEATPPRPGFFLYFPGMLKQFGLLRSFIEHFRDEGR